MTTAPIDPADQTSDTPVTIATMARRITDWVVDQFANNEAYLAWLADQNGFTRHGFDVVAGVLDRIDTDHWTDNQVQAVYGKSGITADLETIYHAFVVTELVLPDAVRGIPCVQVPGVGCSAELGITDTELDMLLHTNPWD